MEQNFDLEVILSVITKIKYKENLNKIYKLYWFLYDDSFMMMDQIVFHDIEVINHIFNIYPELLKIKYNNQFNYEDWIMQQKNIYGDQLIISKINIPLSNKTKRISK